MERIYLDNHATTPVDPRVAEVVYRYMVEDFGNASSMEHSFGKDAHQAVEEARREVALLVGAEPEEVVFTSGATESINIALQGFVRLCHDGGIGRPVRIAAMPLEHRAVLDTISAMEERDLATHVRLEVDGKGCLDPAVVDRACSRGADLICVMGANNEIGNIYPVEQVGRIAADAGVPLLCDATQSAGKVECRFRDWNVTYMALSAHKIYGPKGVGALVKRSGFPGVAVNYGGHQEADVRPGTLNVPGIIGFGVAARLRREEGREDENRIRELRHVLVQELRSSVSDLILNGDPKNRLAGNLNVSFPGIPNQAILARVHHRIALSTGSACSSGLEQPSHVLRTITRDSSVLRGALRIGIGKFNTPDEIATVAEALLAARADVVSATHASPLNTEAFGPIR